MAEMLAKMQADRERREEERRQQDERRRADDEARIAAAKAADEQRALDRETARQNALAERAAREAERLANNPPAPSGSPSVSDILNDYRERFPVSPSSQPTAELYQCEKCKGIIHSKDTIICPHCGNIFLYYKDENGNRSPISSSGSGIGGSNSGRLIILLALGAVFVIGAPIAFIAFLVKILSSKPPPPPQSFGQRQYY